ncbi:type I-E CRISPR-associated protein Cas7/Cse4/CasC [Nocardioides sp. NPDC057764]|uniref:type I-E CRISPR-associated protein Cas7/Cse4/CasC n=1 Tax=Nocardioides sp. NPDC057764 TaxID=3346243 RepID=UPI00366B4DB2
MSTFIDIHVLQTVPSSNINRDDTGSPKSAIFGGVRRARVSSQAWKRATRKDFATYLDATQRGVRTRRVMADLVDQITALDTTLSKDTALDLAKQVMAAASKIAFEAPPKKSKKADAATDADNSTEEGLLSKYLLFLSNQQIARLAELALTGRDGAIDKKAAKQALKDGNGIEVALFGRMIADDPVYNVDAGVQVAHAISTHAVETEYDYYTAVDDAQPGEDSGAGMIGVVEFNSSTLYRYATINLDQLEANIGDPKVTAEAVEAFVRSFVMSMPTGKQNTFANTTLPDAVIAQVRTRRPVNLVGAFEDPIVSKPGVSLSLQSVDALAQKALEVDAAFGTAPTKAYVIAAGSDIAAALDGVGERVGLDELVDQLGQQTAQALAEQGVGERG